ncbi:HAD family phosphatase [Collinsella sp. zg1085]|uniref:HAD family hydrolase n=1 Tax=Collinsella sp. zg1085 TaxID=2844380 RepID=UPI001C0E0D30|nr:HAD family phosphatase [Collinsella sp. zg1085]QWT18018.1 HAD family phosphatase [Collinsella sp. zg1085]
MSSRPSAAHCIPYKAVIFDMDGVLVDTECFYAEALVTYGQDHGLNITREETFSLVGASYQVFRSCLQRWWAEVGRVMSEDEAVESYLTWERAHGIDYASLLNPGVVETLEYLQRAGIRLALASSSPMVNIKHVLSVCKLEHYFEVIVSGEQFEESKPNPQIYLHTLEQLGLPALECCCVEDSEVGIAAGKAAGLTVFAKREERFGFSQAAADHIIDSVFDLVAV